MLALKQNYISAHEYLVTPLTSRKKYDIHQSNKQGNEHQTVPANPNSKCKLLNFANSHSDKMDNTGHLITIKRMIDLWEPLKAQFFSLKHPPRVLNKFF
ncbi:unnamed protein product [Clavelina lepadiformis]|uniref:Uncharacterized protein n=1 Tax=Clavelina lepadiformis TaxID=159417 RepID=A0ABP0FBC8_CLALP